jgi:undecaprenyl diphosphate synthase
MVALAPPPSLTLDAVPKHVAIVMDGNGRWARMRHRPRVFGHHQGLKAVRGVIEACMRRQVPILTLFAFSSENWKRPADEVSALMDLFLRSIQRETDELHRNGVRLRFIGDRGRFPVPLDELMSAAEAKTRGNDRLQLNVAVNYGGRWDIAQAARRAAAEVIAGRLPREAIDETRIGRHLALAELPEPDLLIRTGGETRLSNFLLWQFAYTELYFCNVLWPDFDDRAFDAALLDFAQRERRYGRTSAQVRKGEVG